MNEQGTEEWHLERLGKVTASKISDVMMKPTTAGYQNYLSQLACERLTGKPTEVHVSYAMQHGTDTEPQARAVYEMKTGVDVVQVGFIDHPSIAMSGASPDGEVGPNGLVEIKCPQPTEHIRTLTGGAIKKQYVSQMQWQMACTGREWCDFVSFCPSLPDDLEVHIQRVKRDDQVILEMERAVDLFCGEVSNLIEKLKRATS